MAERILIVDDDVDTMRLVGIMLQRQGYEIIAASNGSQGLEKAMEEKPDLILLDVMMPDMDGYEVTRRLRENPATNKIPILMFTAKTQLDDKVAGFEVGADDYLTKPTHPTELQAHVKALLARTAANNHKDESKNSDSSKGYVIGVISARAGLGVSTFSANLAAALVNRSQADVILAELTPGQGTLASDFGISSPNALTEILKGKPAEITKEKIKKTFVEHNSGIKLLLASENPRDVDLISHVQNFETLVSHLASLARFVVLDLGAGLPTYAQKLLSMCQQQFVILDGTPSNVQYAKLLIDEMVLLRIKRENMTAILNNRQRADAQKPAQVQEKLGHPISVALTPAPEIFLQATRIHSPAVISQPNSITSEQFLKIADAVIKREKA